MNIQSIETGIGHFGDALTSLLKGLLHFTVAAAPIAEAIGTATGNPDVTAAAIIADEVAIAGEKAMAAAESTPSTK